jgi:hypothetical protein
MAATCHSRAHTRVNKARSHPRASLLPSFSSSLLAEPATMAWGAAAAAIASPCAVPLLEQQAPIPCTCSFTIPRSTSLSSLLGQPYLSARASSAPLSFPAPVGGSSLWLGGYGASLRLSYPIPWSPSSVGCVATIGLVSTGLYASKRVDAQSALRHVCLGIELDCSPFVILGLELAACLTLLLAVPPPASNTECCRWLAVATVTPARARPQQPPYRLDNGPNSFTLTPLACRHHHRP